jgi:hypothetical protein
MRTIWKFPLQMRGWNEVEMGAADDQTTQVVLAAIDPESGAPAVWIAGDDEGPPMKRSFGVFPTGGRIAEDAEHVGSMIDRTFVWHIYERTLYHGQ